MEKRPIAEATTRLRIVLEERDLPFSDIHGTDSGLYVTVDGPAPPGLYPETCSGYSVWVMTRPAGRKFDSHDIVALVDIDTLPAMLRDAAARYRKSYAGCPAPETCWIGMAEELEAAAAKMEARLKRSITDTLVSR